MYKLKKIAMAVVTVLAIGLIATPVMARGGSGGGGGSSASSVVEAWAAVPVAVVVA